MWVNGDNSVVRHDTNGLPLEGRDIKDKRRRMGL